MDKKKESGWIDVHNDDVMRNMGFNRPYNVTPRDPSVWTKTDKEKKKLCKVKRTNKYANWHLNMSPTPRKEYTAKLIIYLKKNKKFPKTTYSFIKSNTGVRDCLARFGDCVSKYVFNGILHIC